MGVGSGATAKEYAPVTGVGGAARHPSSVRGGGGGGNNQARYASRLARQRINMHGGVGAPRRPSSAWRWGGVITEKNEQGGGRVAEITKLGAGERALA